MNIDKALIILKLNYKYNIYNINDLKNEELRKTYHILALNYHPDKNKELNAKDKFQDIQNAYIFLDNFINLNNHNIENECTSISYTDLIINFLNLLINNFTNDENNNIKIENEVCKFNTECIEYSYKLIEKLLDKLNINVIEEINKLITNLNNNKKLNISEKIINIIIDIVKNKLKEYNIYIINPDLSNIFNSEIYKLEIENETIYIPLWHTEMNYQKNIIKIEPILDDNITIDENNNLHYIYKNTFENIINIIHNNANKIPNLEILIEEFNLCIPINELNFKTYQIYVFKELGIPTINLYNILDNTKKSNVIIHIYLE